ncbi:ceramide kinase isoform X2 [Thalassophryne amazonica]|uniref:ceramide kinase isoform X2 n=1 Tax=Thalassophryne amazonica TaxID=390379 RepID=UPI001471CF29|nr:ceramide kinase isoform X2 [Thalassophryne amazonica]
MEIMDKIPEILSSELFHRRRQVEVILNRTALSWREIRKNRKRSSRITNISQSAQSHAVPVCEIVAVHKMEDKRTETSRSSSQKDPNQDNLHAFTVSYVRRTSRHQWRCNDITFHCTSQALCQQWIQAINEQLSLLLTRPKSLLVYINPYAGKKHGKRIYKQKVAPLFRCASISADVIVTEYANHARDHLKTEANLAKYDGVVCVGGDGMFSEILHGLVTRTQTDHGVDQNQPDADLVPCLLRVGIIPAGSTDCICFATVGTNDPVTSALHIIVGDSQPVDTCSVHHNNIFLRYSVSLLGYGFYGDVQVDSERKRWLGPARYNLSGVKIFLSHNYYEGTISFLPAEENVGNPRDNLQCRSGCHVCQHKASLKDTCCDTAQEEKPDKGAGGSGGWCVIQGKFIAINAASMSCACPRSPQGLSPSAHLADGTADLILVRKCSRLDFFRHLFRHTNENDQFDHSFVEVHRVQKFHFQPWCNDFISDKDLTETGKKGSFGPICSAPTTCKNSSTLSSWSCDGEILPHTDIQVSVQHQLIRLFARGIEEQQQCTFEDCYTVSPRATCTHISEIKSWTPNLRV